MNNTKKVIILFMVLLLTGCTSKCTANLFQDGFEASCEMKVYYDEYYDNEFEENAVSKEMYDLIHKDLFKVIENGDKSKYTGKLEAEENYGYYYSMTHRYSYDDILKSPILSCFSESEYTRNGETIYLLIKGYNRCSPESELDLTLNIPFLVNSHNGESLKNNEYHWHFKEKEYVNIELKIGEDDMNDYFSYLLEEEQDTGLGRSLLLIAILVVVILLAVVFIQSKRKKNNAL